MDQDPVPVDGAAQAIAAESAPPVDATAEGAGTVLGVDPAQHAQELLAEHVPLALLADLLVPTGDTSADILAAEGLPDEPWWTPQADGTAREA